jgi:hypothetical protein
MKQVAQETSGHIFHHNIMLAILGKGCQHLDNVGVVELAQRLDFASEAFEQGRVVGSEVFEGDRRARVGIAAAIDDTHPALAADGADGKTASQQLLTRHGVPPRAHISDGVDR